MKLVRFLMKLNNDRAQERTLEGQQYPLLHSLNLETLLVHDTPTVKPNQVAATGKALLGVAEDVVVTKEVVRCLFSCI
ncbi:hypothetical protein DY000_02025616 [Brassica cretica]|uniref:Uncharacterized protein n=1 Tax=Brassica cretica TaxID=69181 RepID=A0ABQ7EJP8_BRACR|nr:hypothetical protein DY000_02025616 [Brassica cretica]